MSFRDEPFSKRVAKGGMGDLAEGAYERVAAAEGWSHVRFGFDRPPVQMTGWPTFIRGTPDFIEAHFLVEAVGFGYDNKAKLRFSKLEALEDWSEVFPVSVFFWHSTKSEWSRCEWAHLRNLIDAGVASEGTFPEGNKYAAFAKVDLGLEWVAA